MFSLFDPIVYEQFAISNWLMEAVTHGQKSGNISKTQLTCLVLEDKNNIHYQCQARGSQYTLLLKMLSAINITEDDFSLLAIQNGELAEVVPQYLPQAILILGEGLSLQQSNVFDCPHPSDMLANAPLKRQAWECLKQLKKSL